MEKSIKLALFLLLLFTASTLAAQDSPFSFGVRAGFNVSNNNLDLHEYSEYKTKEPHIGINAGITVDYALSKSFSVQSGLSYTAKGVKLKGFTDWEPSGKEYWDKRFNMGYLQLPLLAVYRYNISDDFNVFINAGPYFAYGIAGKVTVKTRYYNLGDKPDEKEKVNCFGDDGLKRFDWGLLGGIGTELNRISITFNYELGFIDPAKDRNIVYDSSEFKNRNASISLGYRF